MPLILAIQPDSGQASVLRHALRTCSDAALVIVESADAALAAMDRHRPDLVLLHPFMTLGDETRVLHHVGAMPNTRPLQTLTIPQLRSSGGTTDHAPRWLAGILRLGQPEPNAIGCDPREFAEQIGRYLSGARVLG
jgi:CheY-like chemotaxis protein